MMRPARMRSDGGVSPQAPVTAQRSALSIQEFAHELNSLLDGSMRYINLALRALGTGDDVPAGVREHAAEKLRVAEESMREMALMLGRVMEVGEPVLASPAPARGLADVARHVVRALDPLAEAAGVEVALEFDEQAAPVPGGRLAPVLHNGLRNAIEACAHHPPPGGEVCISITWKDSDRLLIQIADTGPGVPDAGARGEPGKPGGHGIGLELSRRIVGDLGGRLELLDGPTGRGGLLRIELPASGLA